MQGPVNGSEVSRHDEIVPGAKTMTPRASADSQLKLKGGVQNCPGWRRQLIKPSVLGFRCKFWSSDKQSSELSSGGVVAWFLQGPVDGCEASRQDEIVPGAKTMTPPDSNIRVRCRLGSGWRGGVVFGGPGKGCDFRVTLKLS